MRSLSKSAFWLISLKPLVQLKNFLCLDNKFCAIFHPFTWIWLYFSPISGKFLPYGQNLNFWLKFCFDFYIFILIYILWTVIDIWESSTHWVYLNQEKNNIWTGWSLSPVGNYPKPATISYLFWREIVSAIL